MESDKNKNKSEKTTFNVNTFEKEYQKFILELKRKKYGDDYVDKLIKKQKQQKEKKEKEKEKKKKRDQKISQLRKDMRDGKLIKVYLGNGQFGWKKVK